MAKLTEKEINALPKELQDKIRAMQRENEVLATAGQGKLTFKVSEKGALSVYGLGRFPVSLYKEQWERLLGVQKDLKEFMANHADRLKTKVQALVDAAGNENAATAPAGNNSNSK
jgi:hypothetical protein